MPDTPNFFIPVTEQLTAKDVADHAETPKTIGASPTEPMADSKAEISLPLVPGYDVLGELGRGGMGVVYKARHVALDRIVALKMVLAGKGARADELTRFTNEASAAAAIQHPNVAQVYEVGRHEGLPFFSLEFCPGGSLATVLRDRLLAPRDAAKLVRALAGAVQVAHDHGVLHRDLKPANVLLAGASERVFLPKITDFGLAKRFDPGSTDSRPDGITHAGTIIGTPSYMSPEQAAGEIAKVGPASDVYSLGAILYECLTRRPPFCGASSLDTLLAVMEDEPIPPSKLTPTVPGDLEAICLKCLEKLPAKRYVTSALLAEDLERFIAGKPTLARPLGAIGRTVKWAKRRPAVAGLVALGLVSLIVLSALSVQLTRANREANRLRNQAEGTAAVALGAIDDILEQEDLPGSGDPEVQRQAMLDAVTRSLQKLGGYGGDDRELLDRSAKASLRRGKLLVDVAQLDEAINVYTQAVALAREQLTKNPEDVVWQRQLGAALNRLGGVYERADKTEPANDAFAQAEDIRRTLAGSTKLNTDEQDLAVTLYNRAGFGSDRGGNEQQISAQFAESRSILSKLVETYPTVSSYQNSLATSWFNWGYHLRNRLNRVEESIRATEQAKAIWTELSRRDPASPLYAMQLASCLNELARLHHLHGEPQIAFEDYRAALVVWRELVKRHPKVATYQGMLGITLGHLGQLELDANPEADRIKQIEEATQALGRAQPLPKFRPHLADAYLALAKARFAGNVPAAGRAVDEAISRYEELTKQFPDKSEYRNQLADAIKERARIKQD